MAPEATRQAGDEPEVVYILLCRHGRAADARGVRSEAPLATAGRDEVKAIGDRLAETLALDRRMRLARVCRGSHRAVRETEAVLRANLRREGGLDGLPEAEEWVELDPAEFAPYTARPRRARWPEPPGGPPADPPMAEETVLRRLRKWCEGAEAGEACLVVGHQPMLSWLGEAILTERPPPFPAGSLPLAREVACIAVERRRRGRTRRWLAWTIEHHDAAEGAALDAALDAKLKAKIEMARWLAGVLVFGLTIFFGALLDGSTLDEVEDRAGGRELLVASGGLLLVALGLFVATLIAYDGLSMPTRFWSESPPSRHPRRWLVRRPPSSSRYVRYQNMVRIWSRLFVPAAVLTIAGLALLGGVALDLPGWGWAAAAGVGVALAAWCWTSRPRLGSED